VARKARNARNARKARKARNMNNNGLIIMAKAPDAERVKTRLMGHIPDEERLNLYLSLLTGTIQKLKEMRDTDTFICFSPSAAESYFSRFQMKIFPQSEGDLGRRMFRAIEKVLHEGYRKAVLVGVDIPELSAPIVERAFDLLSHNDIVFGPAMDGGYYLVGLKRPLREIFLGIEWSTERTLTQSVEKARKLGYTIGYTERLSDLDTPEDLKTFGLG
jgi:rSAM/selenodomain-associated transferase 1